VQPFQQQEWISKQTCTTTTITTEAVIATKITALITRMIITPILQPGSTAALIVVSIRILYIIYFLPVHFLLGQNVLQ